MAGCRSHVSFGADDAAENDFVVVIENRELLPGLHHRDEAHQDVERTYLDAPPAPHCRTTKARPCLAPVLLRGATLENLRHLPPRSTVLSPACWGVPEYLMRIFDSCFGTGFGRYLIERKISVCTAPVAHTTTRAISY